MFLQSMQYWARFLLIPSEVVKPLINFYHINLYGCYRSGYSPVYEQNTIKKN